MAKQPVALAWVDLETTGSDVRTERIVEIAVVVTDLAFQPLEGAEFTAVVGSAAALDRLRENTVVREMHRVSGLLAQLETRADLPSEAEVDDELHAFLSRYGRAHELMLAGSGVCHFDRRFVAVWLPRTTKYVQYPTLDVGVVRRFLGFTSPGLLRPRGAAGKTHRALDDIRVHIAEAQEYRQLLLRAT